LSLSLLSALTSKLGEYDSNPVRDDGEYEFVCPRCPKQDGKRKLGVNVSRKVFNCFRCGWRGRLVDLLRALGINPLSLGPDLGIRPVAASDTYGPKVRPDQIPGYTPLPEPDQPMSRIEQVAYDYCRERGLDDVGEVTSLRLGTSTEKDLAGRLVIPVFEDGRMAGYFARSLFDYLEPKDKVGPEYLGWAPKGELAYGLDLMRPGHVLVLVEGFWDWVRVRKVSRSLDSLALLGSNLGPVAAGKILARRPGRIVVMLDGDEAGERGTRKIVSELLVHRKFASVHVARPPVGKDPDELTAGTILALVNEAIPAVNWLIKHGR